MSSNLDDILRLFEPISLAEMESVKLMNRIDTKYVVSVCQLPAILNKAKADYYVQDIEGVRVAQYDTMYYDTPQLDMYIRHHDRQLVRQKIRIREYVDSDLTFLEIKRKNNKGRTKKKRIVISDALRQVEEIKEFVGKKSWYNWDELSPKLRTVFHRITLVNKAKTERLTIDLDLRFENQVNGVREQIEGMVIIELKRDGNQPSPMLKIMQSEHVKPLKVSKYCIGTALTNPLIKHNRFKDKIRKIRKICYSQTE